MTFDRNDDTKLGYKNPPPWSRFQKGRSGNPKGRPKKKSLPKTQGDSAVDDALRNELRRKVRVKDADGFAEVEVLEVVTRALAAAAVNGNVHAQRVILKDARDLAERDMARKEAEEEQRRRIFRSVAAWKEDQTRAWAAAARAGVEPAEPWPHPDDMHLDEAHEKWRIHGPSCESELPMYEYFRAARDRLFAQAELNRRKTRSGAQFHVSLADVAWSIYDRVLPTRWRIQDKIDPWRPLDKLTTRQLQKELERLAERAAQMKERAKLPPHDKVTYRTVNRIMKPLLKALGYRSLAHFESVCETSGAG